MDKRKWLERAKTALIVLLVLSAALLLWQADVLQGGRLLGYRTGSTIDTDPTAISGSEAIPILLAVTGSDGKHFSAAYNQSDVSQAYDVFSSALAQALSSAGRPAIMSEAQWIGSLTRNSLYLDFAANVPLEVLAAWLGSSCDLAYDARFVVLSCDDDGNAWLCFLDASDGIPRQCSTDLSAQTLSSLLEGFSPNDARFAFELKNPGLLSRWTLLPAELPQSLLAADAQNPIRSGLDPESLLTCFGMNRFVASRYPGTDGTTVYVDGDCSLRVESDGLILFRQTGTDVLNVPSMSPVDVTAAAKRLLSSCTASCGGVAQLRLTGLTESASGRTFVVRFDYVINGVPVRFADSAAAEITVTDGVITEARIRLRQYTITNRRESPLPPLQAAAVVSVTGGTPLLIYEDTNDTVSLCWIVT